MDEGAAQRRVTWCVLLEAVADAACGLDAVGDRAELLAEAAHDDVHDVASADVRRAPDLLDELGAGHGAARSFGQRCEHAEFEGRELHPFLPEIDGAVGGVEEPPVGDSEFGGGEAGQPAVDGLGAELERHEVERVVADADRFREGLESQHRERVGEGGGIGERGVEPTELGTHPEVVPLDVEPRGGLGAARSLTRVAGEGAPVHERCLPVAAADEVRRAGPTRR